jgi:hypothetical protein
MLVERCVRSQKALRLEAMHSRSESAPDLDGKTLEAARTLKAVWAVR